MKVPLAVRALPPVAIKAWWTPPRSRKLSLSQALANPGFAPISVDVDGREVKGFRTGDGPLVVLIHGWGGQAAQMASIASSLAEEGFTAISLDLPGHGGDEQKTSNAFEMAGAIKSLVAEHGEPVAVVAHSLGTIVTQIAFEAGLPNKTVLISPLLDAEAAVNGFVRQAQLFSWTERRLHHDFKSFVGDSWWDRMTRGSGVDLGGGDLLVIHDSKDRQTSFDMAAGFAARRADTTFLPTQGLGHGRILSDPEVLTAITDFVGSDVTVSA